MEVPFPQKKTFGNMDSGFLQERRFGLQVQYYVQNVLFTILFLQSAFFALNVFLKSNATVSQVLIKTHFFVDSSALSI